MVFLNFLKQLHFYYNITLAFLPRGDFVEYSADPDFETIFLQKRSCWLGVIETEMTSPKEYFFLGVDVQTAFTPTNYDHTMVALRDAFVFKTGFRFDRFEIGYNHFCTHPIALYYKNEANKNSLHGAYDEIYITFSNKKRKK